ncbi:hypothetical protein BGZ63DRAFT_363984 [Mariannaea sp. PMI_226]|nr:hypothetical protein BGZ63DRAFT_363984 [Mariannaea sp. PMI_226]
MGRQSRLLSCQLCRVRKLRCSREFPCSNCTARGVQCSAINRPVQQHQAAGSQVGSQAELLSRLEKVEALLAARVHGQHSPGQSSDVPGVLNHAVSNASTPPAHYEESLPPKLRNLIKDVAFIDRACFDSTLNDFAVDDDFVIHTCPIRLCAQCSSNAAYNYNPSASPHCMSTTKHIWLPNRDDAEIMVCKYLADISQINNIVHGPSVRKLVAEVYEHPWQGSTPAPVGSIILLLSILALVTHLWPPEDDKRSLFSDYREANAQTMLWIKHAFDAIEGCRRKTDVSLECVQGLVILSTTLLSMEGFSSRACATLSRATAISRELGLHRLDHAISTPRDSQPLTGLKAEIGRRVWWHLAATDWILASCSGPQRGTYSINPLHMAVAKPLNLNDEDITERGAVPQPIETSTSMSYSLQRIRLAEEIRAVVDRAPLTGLDPYAVGYEHIQDADATIERFLQTAPNFFSLGVNSHEELPKIDPDLSRTIIFQRYVLTLFAYGQRCRLQLPYFIRGAVEKEYWHSRKVSLMSARIIIDAERRVRDENFEFGFSRFKLGVVTYSYFMAVTIMVVDLCQMSDENEKAIKLRELESAWSILEEAQAQSTLINGGAETLKQMMKKHNIRFSTKNIGNSQQFSAFASMPMDGLNLQQRPGISIDQYKGAKATLPLSVGPDTGGMGPGIDTTGVDWDHLKWVLEAPFL